MQPSRPKQAAQDAKEPGPIPQPGWVLAVGASDVLARAPEGSTFRVPTEGAATLGELPAKRLAELGDLGAVRLVDARDDDQSAPDPDDVWGVTISGELPDHVTGAFRDAGFQVSASQATKVVVVVPTLADDLLHNINRAAVETKRWTVPVSIQRGAVTVGPLAAPSIGGPCLECVYQRSRAALLTALEWPPTDQASAVCVGSQPPRESDSLMASRLTRDWAMGLPQLPGHDLLTNICRLSTLYWTADRVKCYPLPWCPGCSVSQSMPTLRPVG